jgi:hypothetical protein
MNPSNAETELTQNAQGTYVAVPTPEEMVTTRKAKVDSSVSDVNILLRPIVSSRLLEFPHQCLGYSIQTTEETLSIQCDDKPRIGVRLDGAATQYPKPDGTTFDVIASVDGNTIVQEFPGKNGNLVVTYDFSDGFLLVTKSVDSSYLTKPMDLVIRYKQQ